MANKEISKKNTQDKTIDKTIEKTNQKSKVKSKQDSSGIQTKAKKNNSKSDEKQKNKHLFGRIIAKARNSVYNVDEDMKLENYKNQEIFTDKISTVLGVLGVLIVIGIVVYLIIQAIFFSLSFFNTQEYELAIANQFITDENFEQFTEIEEVKLDKSGVVYLRFQWEEKPLNTDYLKIILYRFEEQNKIEKSAFGRTIPNNKNFIYFMGLLDKGDYVAEIFTRDNQSLKKKKFRVF